VGTLYDQTGKPVDVPDQQVTQGLLSGQYSTTDPTVTVKTATGKVFDVPTENLAKFNQSVGGVQVLSAAEKVQHQQEKAQQALQQQYGGFGSQLAAGAIGAGDALTLGLGTGLVGAVGGEDVKHYIRNVEAANPISTTLGNVLGLVAPAVATMGGSLLEEAPGALSMAARGLAAPTRAVGALGELGAGVTTRALGEGALGRIASGAVRGTLEGSVYGAGSQLSEDILGDHELTAERLLAGMGRGALAGGVLGAGASTLGFVAEKGLQKASELVEGGGLADRIAKRAAEMQFTATGAKTKEIRQLANHGLETEEVGRWMLDEMPQFAEGGKNPITREGILKAANAAMEDATPKIQAKIAELDAAGARPDAAPIFLRLRSEIAEPLLKHVDPGVQSIGNHITKLVDNAEARLGDNATFTDLFKLRREIEDGINYNKAAPDMIAAAGEKRAVRAIVEDELGKQGEAAMAGVDPTWRTGYDAAKRQFRMAISVAKATESADKRIAGNLKAGLSDKIIAAHGLTALAVGHPLGAVAALGAAAANHLVTHYGDAVASRMLDKFSKLEAVRGLSFDVSRATSDSMRALISTTHAGAVGDLVRLPASFDKKREEVNALASSPQAFTAAMAPHMPTVAPKVAAAMASKAQAIIADLQATMPGVLPTGSLLTPQLGAKPSKMAQEKWLEKVDVFEKPMSVFEDMRKGLLTPNKAAAFRQYNPKMLEHAINEMVEQVAEHAKGGKEPSFKAMQQMSILTGKPLHAMMQPAFVQSQQALYVQPEKSDLQEHAPGAAAKLDLHVSRQLGTETQQIEDRET
jgi:hypothetical protein